jgi:dihydroflavonol-4-reductase
VQPPAGWHAAASRPPGCFAGTLRRNFAIRPPIRYMGAMVVVTGANGHIGANVVRALLQQGLLVRAVVHRNAAALVGLGVELVPGNVEQAEGLREAFAGADVVIHLAAMISITGSQGGAVERMNVEGARNAARAAREAGVRRLVHVSSIHAWHLSRSEALTEESPRATADDPAYDRSKAEGEAQVREEVAAGLDAVIVNPSGVIGPYDYAPSRMGQMLVMMAEGAVPALVDGGFDWVDARDVAASIVAATTRGRSGESYLLGGHWASIREVAELVAAAGGKRPPRLNTPRWLAESTAGIAEWAQRAVGMDPLFTSEGLRALYEGSRQVVTTKAQQELGHTARPLAETVADTLAWFREEGRL